MTPREKLAAHLGVTLSEMRCACCRQHGHLTLDHIIARGLGGSNAPENWQPLCDRCQAFKSAQEGRFKYATWGQAALARHDGATKILRSWQRKCAQQRHNQKRACRCPDCMAAPIVFGQGNEEAG